MFFFENFVQLGKANLGYEKFQCFIFHTTNFKVVPRLLNIWTQNTFIGKHVYHFVHIGLHIQLQLSIARLSKGCLLNLLLDSYPPILDFHVRCILTKTSKRHLWLFFWSVKDPSHGVVDHLLHFKGPKKPGPRDCRSPATAPCDTFGILRKPPLLQKAPETALLAECCLCYLKYEKGPKGPGLITSNVFSVHVSSPQNVFITLSKNDSS